MASGGRRREWVLGGLGIAVLLAVVKVGIHLATGWRYGFHRDEFYYITGGLHPAFGYVDHPPAVPLLAGAVYRVFGDSLLALRISPALAGAALVVGAAWLAGALGGGRFAQVVAAVLMLACPLYLITNSMFQTVSFDHLAWFGVIALTVQLIRTGDRRLWRAIGVVFGAGLLIKYTIGLLAIGLLAGLLLTPHRHWLRMRWPYLGGLVAVVIASPNLIWQVINGFPTLEFIRNNSAAVREDGSLFESLLLHLLQPGPLAVPFIVAGAVFLLRADAGRFRLLGVAFLTTLLLVLVLGAKPYYIGPIYPLMFAAGAVAVESFAGRREWSWQRPAVITALAVGNMLVMFPYFVAVLPEETAADIGVFDLNEDMAEMVGWPDFVQTVATIYDGLPPEEQEHVAILTLSYGEAGAIDVLGGEYGLPNAVSGHNSYSFWGARGRESDVAIVTVYRHSDIAPYFEDCQQVAVIENRFGVENEMSGRPIHLCRGAHEPLPDLLEHLRHFR